VLLRQKAEALQERYDQSIFQARVEANTKRVEIITRAKSEAVEIVSKAEADAAQVLKEGRENINRQMAECRQKAEDDSRGLAELLSHKVDSELSVH
jgi:F0F1-type ATP synthase membrane subunit b/b'